MCNISPYREGFLSLSSIRCCVLVSSNRESPIMRFYNYPRVKCREIEEATYRKLQTIKISGTYSKSWRIEKLRLTTKLLFLATFDMWKSQLKSQLTIPDLPGQISSLGPPALPQVSTSVSQAQPQTSHRHQTHGDGRWTLRLDDSSWKRRQILERPRNRSDHQFNYSF